MSSKQAQGFILSRVSVSFVDAAGALIYNDSDRGQAHDVTIFSIGSPFFANKYLHLTDWSFSLSVIKDLDTND